jgi:hypothetical protein
MGCGDYTNNGQEGRRRKILVKHIGNLLVIVSVTTKVRDNNKNASPDRCFDVRLENHRSYRGRGRRAVGIGAVGPFHYVSEEICVCGSGAAINMNRCS